MTSDTVARPRRSALYMPASNARALRKARGLPVDAVILDLEDAVAPVAKEQARDQACDAVREGGFGKREVIVRVNALDTPWGTADLMAVAAAAPDAILLPKVGSAAELRRSAARLDSLAAPVRPRLWAMIETSRAVLDILAIADAARECGVDVLVMGLNDLAKETGARLLPGRGAMLPWLMQCLAAARASGLDILDGVFNDIADTDEFRRECEQGRDIGLDGKSLIHPSQIETCNAIFSPAPEELEWANAVTRAFADPANADAGVIQLDGRMVERLHLAVAQRLLRRSR